MAKEKKSEPQPLSRARIGEAALALIDREGLQSFSARRLAGALGCEAMSLYHHVENMEDVLDLVVDEILSSLQEAGGGEPKRQLLEQARAFLTLAETHPEAFVLVPTRRWRTPNAARAASASVALFAAAGALPREALRRARILGAYLGGAGLALAAWRKSASAEAAPIIAQAMGPPGALNAEAVRADLDAGLRRLLDALIG